MTPATIYVDGMAGQGTNQSLIKEYIYASELATYKRDTGNFRRRNYQRHCKNKGIQPLSAYYETRIVDAKGGARQRAL